MDQFLSYYSDHRVEVWLAVALTITGFLLSEATRWIYGQIEKSKEVRENQHIDVSGEDWFAAWQAAVDDTVVINTEEIVASQRGATVWMHNKQRSPENPIGGFMWKARLLFSHGETLMGWYHPIKTENITSRGIMYLTYDSQRRLMAGKWVGKSYDGNLCSGFVCIAKDRDRAKKGVETLIEMSPRHPVNILGGVPLRIA